jgi:hypothetical protein
MNDFIARFWSLDKLLGPVLAKIVYYLGLAAITLMVFAGVVSGLFALFVRPISGLLMLAGAPLFGAIAVIWWRFLIELSVLGFEIYARLGDIRDRLPPPPETQF